MFNIDEAPESKETSYTLLPKGGYRVVVAEVKFKYKVGDVDTNWFSVRFDVLPFTGVGEYDLAGRRLYNNYTWENHNAQAREIGHAQLADLMFACGAKSFSSPDQLPPLLEGVELYIDVYHAKRKDNNQDEARIGGYWTHDGKQRKANPKPIPVPPTAAAIASAPAQAPRNTTTQSAPHGHPAFDDAPF